MVEFLLSGDFYFIFICFYLFFICFFNKKSHFSQFNWKISYSPKTLSLNMRIHSFILSCCQV